MVGVFVAFIRVVYGRMIYMSLPGRPIVWFPSSIPLSKNDSE